MRIIIDKLPLPAGCAWVSPQAGIGKRRAGRTQPSIHRPTVAAIQPILTEYSPNSHPLPPTLQQASMAHLELEGIVQRYGSHTVVDGVGFSVETGTIACLLGPSGCGKNDAAALHRRL
jgi:ABC-type glutathione transport system ATPase component